MSQSSDSQTPPLDQCYPGCERVTRELRSASTEALLLIWIPGSEVWDSTLSCSQVWERGPRYLLCERWFAGQDAFPVPFPDVHPCGIGDSSACDPRQVTVTPHAGFHTCSLSRQMLTEGRCWVSFIFYTSSLPHGEHHIRFVASGCSTGCIHTGQNVMC